VKKLPQSIFAKAFRSELVEQDPNDEPAEILLKKMKRRQ
jgi:type I restriction enzyme S subunit